MSGQVAGRIDEVLPVRRILEDTWHELPRPAARARCLGRKMTFPRVLVIALAAFFVAGCDGDGGEPVAAKTSTTTTSTTTTTTTTTTVPPTTAPTQPAVVPYQSGIATVTAADLGASWREGCPVGPEDLRWVTVTFIGFDGLTHTGAIVVHADEANNVVEVFRQLFVARFPIRKMKPIFTQFEYEDFDTVDDNSSGFWCRQHGRRRQRAALVEPRVRPGDRHQPDRKPVPQWRQGAPTTGCGVHRSQQRSARDGRRRRRPRERVPLGCSASRRRPFAPRRRPCRRLPRRSTKGGADGTALFWWSGSWSVHGRPTAAVLMGPR